MKINRWRFRTNTVTARCDGWKFSEFWRRTGASPDFKQDVSTKGTICNKDLLVPQRIDGVEIVK